MTTLRYTVEEDKVYKNIMLIDDTIRDYKTFVESANEDTLPIVYQHGSTRDELSSVLDSIYMDVSFQRIVFVFEENIGTTSFLEQQPFFTSEDLTEEGVFSENLQFMIEIIGAYGVTSIDFLACNLLQYSNWKKYFEILTTNTSVVVGASNDLTGNLLYGGNWTLESTSEDVTTIYFTEYIQTYKYLLKLNVYDFNFIVDTSGNLWSTGEINNTNTSSTKYIKNTDLSNIVTTTGSPNAAFALTFSGDLYAVGTNTLNIFGLGPGDNIERTFFTDFQKLDISNIPDKVVRVTSNGNSTFLTTFGGDVYGCGNNSNGELGLGDTTYRNRFEKITDMSGVVDVQSGGAFTIAITKENKVYGCGNNSNRQFGGLDSSTVFQPILEDVDLSEVQIGLEFMIYLTKSGDVYGSGRNVFGALGTGGTGTVSNFQQLTTSDLETPLSNIKKIYTSVYNSYVIDESNTLYGAGINNGFGMGTLDTTIPTFTKITIPGSIKRFIAFFQYMYLITDSDELYSAGKNESGRLGLGDVVDDKISFTEVPITEFTPFLFFNDYDDSLFITEEEISEEDISEDSGSGGSRVTSTINNLGSFGQWNSNGSNGRVPYRMLLYTQRPYQNIRANKNSQFAARLINRSKFI